MHTRGHVAPEMTGSFESRANRCSRVLFSLRQKPPPCMCKCLRGKHKTHPANHVRSHKLWLFMRMHEVRPITFS